MSRAIRTDGPPAPAGLSRRALLTGAAGLVVAGVAAGGVLVLALRPPAAPKLVAPTPTGDRVTAVVAARIPLGFRRPAAGVAPTLHVPPVEVAVPAIAVRSRLVGLRLNNDTTLQVPADYGVAGWYSDGPAPGDTGMPAVIVGHVDSYTGPGVFYRLPEVRTGDNVLIRRADGNDLRFVVYRTVSYSKDHFPTRTVYAAHRTAELRLITCTGTFDKASGHYESNRVVYARLTAPARPRAPVAHRVPTGRQGSRKGPAG